MEVTGRLWNHAEAVKHAVCFGKRHRPSGLFRPGQPGPWQVSFGLGIEVLWTATNQAHSVRVTLGGRRRPAYRSVVPFQKAVNRSVSTSNFGLVSRHNSWLAQGKQE
ncbi:hypothetical protein MLPF_1029 [Mycobacterium lepromatosis]|nr:hypothetical protein MLPF_1029 [Mycobacterium lepromatosis]